METRTFKFAQADLKWIRKNTTRLSKEKPRDIAKEGQTIQREQGGTREAQKVSTRIQKKNREKMKEYERRRYMKKKDGCKVEEERPSLMNANQNLEEETSTRILPNEIEPPQNLWQVENMYEGREILSKESKRLLDEIEELHNLI